MTAPRSSDTGRAGGTARPRWALGLGIALLALAGCHRQAAAPQARPDTPAASAAAESASAGAASTRPGVPTTVAAPATGADLEAGAALAAQGQGAAAACNACHGAQGEGQAAARYPRLAGLGADYLQAQLDSYATGSRQHPVMGPIAQALTADQRRQAAAYFASLDLSRLSARPTTVLPARSAAAQLAWQGDEARQLQACANCHGRDGSGLGSRIPPLAGQPSGYLEDSLAAWREGRRHNDESGQMPRIARALRPVEVSALAAWYAALPLPRPATQPAPRFQTAMEAVTSGPVGPAPTSQGVGSEQGAPLTGGGIGPGGGGATQRPPGASAPR